MQALTVTRNIGNATSFQAGSKTFGPSVALTTRMRYCDKALGSDGKNQEVGAVTKKVC